MSKNQISELLSDEDFEALIKLLNLIESNEETLPVDLVKEARRMRNMINESVDHA